MDIKQAIDRLGDAMERAGVAPPVPPTDLAAVTAIQDAVAPLRLPPALRSFWERLDPGVSRLAVYPELATPSFALDTWRMHAETPMMVPPLLLTLCYSSHVFLMIELEGPDGPGGAIFKFAYAGSPFELMHHSLAEFVDTVAEAVEEHPMLTPWGSVEPGGYMQRAAQRLARATPHPLYGRLATINDDARGWPVHWLRALGLTREHVVPRGATHTIAAALDAATSGPLQATVTGKVLSLVGSGRGARVLIEDATGLLEIWCPAGVSLLGPAMGRHFEFDVAVERGPVRVAPDLSTVTGEVQLSALAGDVRSAQEGLVEYLQTLDATPPPAEAKAVRPLGGRWSPGGYDSRSDPIASEDSASAGPTT